MNYINNVTGDTMHTDIGGIACLGLDGTLSKGGERKDL